MFIVFISSISMCYVAGSSRYCQKRKSSSILSRQNCHCLFTCLFSPWASSSERAETGSDSSLRQDTQLKTLPTQSRSSVHLLIPNLLSDTRIEGELNFCHSQCSLSFGESHVPWVTIWQVEDSLPLFCVHSSQHLAYPLRILQSRAQGLDDPSDNWAFELWSRRKHRGQSRWKPKVLMHR